MKGCSDVIDGSEADNDALDGTNTLHYVDPPYLRSTRTAHLSNGAQQYAHEMTDDDHRALASALRRVKGMVVLSGYPSSLYADLFGDWHTVTKRTSADMGVTRVECLLISPAAWHRLQGAQQQLFGNKE